MPLDFDAPEDAGGSAGNFLQTPGIYHFVVSHVEERAAVKDKPPLDAIRIHATVVDGSVCKDGVCTEREKDVQLTIYDPKPTDKDGGAFGKKKQARAFIALSAMKPQDLGKRVKIDLTNCVGRQFIAKINVKDGDRGGKFAELSYADIYHVDDPEAAGFRKDENAIKTMIPAQFRLPPEAFSALKNAKEDHSSNQGGGNGSTRATPAPTTSTSVDDDVAALLLAE